MEYRIGALWIGGSLSWLEQLCLKSFVDAGQEITLYSYEPIPNVPEGVRRADAATVLPLSGRPRHGRTGSPAHHSDVFRYHLLAQNPGLIWADTDAFCLRPFTTRTGHFYAWESGHGVASGVLGLPPDSETLRALLDFTSDDYGIPPWFAEEEQARLKALRDAGRPVHAADQPWGVWGPAALTHFLKATGEIRFALPRETLYPFRYRDRRQMLKPGVRVEDYVTPETFSIHFYGRRMRARVLETEPSGAPRPRSVLGRLLRQHGIDPAAAPLQRPAVPPPPELAGEGSAAPEGDSGRRAAPDGDAPPAGAGGARPGAEKSGAGRAAAASVAAPWRAGPGDLARLRRVADLTLSDPELLWQIWQSEGAELILLTSGPRGLFGHPRRARALRADLLARGVPPRRVRLARSPEDLRPVDLVLNLPAGAGEEAPLPPGAVLKRLLKPGTRILSRGSAGSDAGRSLEALGPTTPCGGPAGAPHLLTQVGAEAGRAGTWSAIARDLAGEAGFFREQGRHSFLFLPRSPEVLVVTFDNLDLAMNRRADRRPWGFDFIARQGWSMLGVMAAGWTWYRDPFVEGTFDRLRDEGFFDRFGRVVFYGASMGGYAAAAFSAAAPGADVVVMAPQSTLARDLVPWETRYRRVWNRDFSGRYGDAAEVSAAARQVTLLCDPFEPLDARHAARFTAPNVRHLRGPLLGHRLGSSLAQMGVLSEITLAALDGSLTPGLYHRLLRQRRSFPRYQRELFERALARGHPLLARRMAERALQLTENPPLRRALRRAREEAGEPAEPGAQDGSGK